MCVFLSPWLWLFWGDFPHLHSTKPWIFEVLTPPSPGGVPAQIGQGGIFFFQEFPLFVYKSQHEHLCQAQPQTKRATTLNFGQFSLSFFFPLTALDAHLQRGIILLLPWGRWKFWLQQNKCGRISAKHQGGFGKCLLPPPQFGDREFIFGVCCSSAGRHHRVFCLPLPSPIPLSLLFPSLQSRLVNCIPRDVYFHSCASYFLFAPQTISPGRSSSSAHVAPGISQ